MIKVNKKIIWAIMIILIPIVLFLSNSIAIFNTEIKNYPELNNFFKYDQSLPGEYSEQEIIHLHEVRDLVKNLNSILVMGIILLILSLISLSIRNKKSIPSALYYGGFITTTLCFIIIAFVLINFDLFFLLFHKLFFNTSNYILSSNSKLIQTFPSYFWSKISLKIFLLIFGQGIIISIIGRVTEKRKWVEGKN